MLLLSKRPIRSESALLLCSNTEKGGSRLCFHRLKA